MAVLVSFKGHGPQFDDCNIHTVTAFVKEWFLREGPIIPKNFRSAFIQAAKERKNNSDPQALIKAISELPQVRKQYIDSNVALFNLIYLSIK